MSKRLVALLLIVTMLALSACTPAASTTTAPPAGSTTTNPPATGQAPTQVPPSTDSNFNLTGYPIVNETVTLEVFQHDIENQTIDWANLWYYQELEKKTNVHINFEPIKGPDWETKFNLMVASGDYPDLCIGSYGLSLSILNEEYGVTQGVFIPLDGLIAQYMPNYAPRLEMNDSKRALVASDGQMYAIGFLIAQAVTTDSAFFINRNWLDKLSLQVPTTINELTDVLRAFRDNDPNGNGKKDEVPYSAVFSSGPLAVMPSFGVPANGRYVYLTADDKVGFIGDLPGFRESLEWVHLLYTEGLIDQESLTQDGNVWATKMNSDIVGYMSYLRLINTALTQDIYTQFECILPPAADGYSVSYPRILELPTFSAALTSQNEKLEITARWIDANMETETMMISQNGPLEPIEGNPMFAEPCMKVNDQGMYEILRVPENNGLYSILPVIMGFFFAPADYYSNVYVMAPHRLERYENCLFYEENGVIEEKSYQYLTTLASRTTEEELRLNEIYVELSKYMKEYMNQAMSDGVTDASYDTFMNTVKQIGLDEYMTIYQTAYDRFLSTP